MEKSLFKMPKRTTNFNYLGRAAKILPRTFWKTPNVVILSALSPLRGAGLSRSWALFYFTSESPSPKMTFLTSKPAPGWPQKFAETQNHPDFLQKITIKSLSFSQETKAVPEGALQSFYYFFTLTSKVSQTCLDKKKKPINNCLVWTFSLWGWFWGGFSSPWPQIPYRELWSDHNPLKA